MRRAEVDGRGEDRTSIIDDRQGAGDGNTLIVKDREIRGGITVRSGTGLTPNDHLYKEMDTDE